MLPIPFCDQSPTVQSRVLLGLARHVNTLTAERGIIWSCCPAAYLESVQHAAMEAAACLGPVMASDMGPIYPQAPHDLLDWSALPVAEQAEHLRQISRWAFEQWWNPDRQSAQWAVKVARLERAVADLADWLARQELSAWVAPRQDGEGVRVAC